MMSYDEFRPANRMTSCRRGTVEQRRRRAELDMAYVNCLRALGVPIRGELLVIRCRALDVLARLREDQTGPENQAPPQGGNHDDAS